MDRLDQLFVEGNFTSFLHLQSDQTPDHLNIPPTEELLAVPLKKELPKERKRTSKDTYVSS